MLQNLRTCQRAFLGDVSYEYDRHAAGLGKAQQRAGTFAHLGDAACRRLYIFSSDGLYGVNNHEVGLHLLYVSEDGLQRRLA